MNSTLLRRLSPLLLGSSMAFGLTAANAEELRIGYVAPTTGIFAQVGKDMVDGFKMYLDEHKNKFVSADVKFIVAGHRRHQGQEAHPSGQGALVRWRPARFHGLRAGACEHR